MKKKWLLIIGLILTLAIASLAGCSPGNQEVNFSSQQEGIWVTGQGKVT
ncbi:unnamed protein product, partial [marine sediment metagenome]